MQIYISWPGSMRHGPDILPVFLPFSGCRVRCIFCAQHLQTGVGERDVYRTLECLEHRLEERSADAPPLELGFFGGTFTAFPPEHFTACLALVRRHRSTGRICTARCSTRPDAVDAERLGQLAEAGFHMVELGVQSYADPALNAARRGYDAATAEQACAAVRGAGLELGVQLLPGMPGSTPEIFRRDVACALECGAQALRFYPCLVIKGTPLADLWRQGDFIPWTLKTTVSAFAEGWLAARRRGVPVIRMGLAQEPGLDARILAGPAHPALGSMVQGEALLRAVEEAVQEHFPPITVRELRVPRACRGFFWGHKNILRERWSALGVKNSTVVWHDGPEVVARL